MSDGKPTEEKDQASYQGTLDEHRECMQHVVALEACLDRRPDDRELWVGALLKHLHDLIGTMREHFSAEEEGPLFSEMPLRRPRTSDRIAALKDEHPRLLAEAERIIQVADGLSEPELHELREFNSRIQLFIARLRRHEATENELIFEAYWDDYGTGD